MIVNIYLASSIKGIRKQDGVVAFILEAEGKENKTLTQFGRVEQATENTAYLRALKYALRRINTKCGLVIWADSPYMANAFSQGWLYRWEQNAWQNAKGREVADRADWEEIAERLNGELPEFRIGCHHTFRKWMETEVEKRAEKIKQERSRNRGKEHHTDRQGQGMPAVQAGS
ncbi:MAG: hypothetical protein NC126_09220 [Clostridium sp.]|nr:hypothetical protein [Clostridium sp.]